MIIVKDLRFLRYIFFAVDVDEDTDVDADDGDDDTEQSDWSQLADESYPNVDHNAYNNQQNCAIRPEVVIHDFVIFSEVAVQGQLWRQIILLGNKGKSKA